MNYNNERRQHNRYSLNLPIQICIGTQIILDKMVRDISNKSAFVLMEGSVFINRFDELDFKIEVELDNFEFKIEGKAQVLRVDSPEGIVLSFKKLEGDAQAQLEKLVIATHNRRQR